MLTANSCRNSTSGWLDQSLGSSTVSIRPHNYRSQSIWSPWYHYTVITFSIHAISTISTTACALKNRMTKRLVSFRQPIVSCLGIKTYKTASTIGQGKWKRLLISSSHFFGKAFMLTLESRRFPVLGEVSVSTRGLRSRMQFPGNRIFPKKIREIFCPLHSGKSYFWSRLSTGIRDWLFPGLV